jgi:hypothetical protein
VGCSAWSRTPTVLTLNLIFTDGSVLTAQQTNSADQDEELPNHKASTGLDRLPASRQLVGAGLFIPNKTPEQLGIAGSGAADATPHDAQHANGTLLYINPSGEGPTNTITRAESAAIHEALQYGTNIATDSAACHVPAQEHDDETDVHASPQNQTYAYVHLAEGAEQWPDH